MGALMLGDATKALAQNAKPYVGPAAQYISRACSGAAVQETYRANFTSGNWGKPSTIPNAKIVGPGPMNAVKSSPRGQTLYGNKTVPIPGYRTYGQSNGASCLEIEYLKGYWLSGYNALIPLKPADRYYMEYDITFPIGFNFTNGFKLPGLAGWPTNPATGNRRYQPVSGGSEVTGTSGFSARYMTGVQGMSALYLYAADKTGKWGGCNGCNFNNNRNKVFHAGRTHRVGQQIIMNTPGKANGIARVWLDGKLVVEKTDIYFRDVSWVKNDTLWLISFFGGDHEGWAPRKDERLSICNVHVKTDPPFCKR